MSRDPATHEVHVVRARGQWRANERDRAAVEEPLEIRIHDEPFAVIMRTPGADRELAAGFLLAERVIRSSDDLGTLRHCADRGSANVIVVTLADSTRADAVLASRRRVTTTASCGLCGRLTIESLESDADPLTAGWSIAASTLAALADRLRAGQRVFDETGGLHAAGLFSRSGELVDLAEDVGRHNAVDKVIGRALLRDALPLTDRVLMVSGRTSFEIIQKALFAGIPIVASVSAPSSLAIDLASAMGITLAGFVRGDGFNLYTGVERVEFEGTPAGPRPSPVP